MYQIQAILLVSIALFGDCSVALTDESLEGEYIIYSTEGKPEDSELNAFIETSATREFRIGGFYGALVKVADPEHLSNYVNQGARIVPNRLVHASQYNESSVCYRQQSGQLSWALTRISHRDLPAFEETDSYFSNETGSCVDIYVMDSGVNVWHRAFEGRAYYGYTAEELYKEEGHGDLSGHGTHVAGLVAGTDYGTAKHANIFSVKVLNRNSIGSLLWLLEGLEWISENVQPNATSVINLSLGIPDRGELDFLEDILGSIPAVSVVAAGNEDDDACKFVPAKFKSVITIGATNQYDRLPSYTNIGTCVDLLAPGHNVISASHLDNTGSRIESGTSMSTGFVSGVVARLLQNYLEQPNTAEILEVLTATATKGRTNAPNWNTPDLIVFASCDDSADIISDQLPEWRTTSCYGLPADSCYIDSSFWGPQSVNPYNQCQHCDFDESDTAWTWFPDKCFIEEVCWDDGVPNPDNACQVCNSAEYFEWTWDQSKCFIESVCWDMDSTHPSHDCKHCEPGTSTDDWTLMESKCFISNECYDDAEPNPENGCQLCDTKRSTQNWSWDESKCFIESVCWDMDSTHPSHDCKHCEPGTSTDDWTLMERKCFIDDVCLDSDSSHWNATCLICDPNISTDEWTLTENTCFIENQCWEGDMINPNKSCQFCDPDTSHGDWTLDTNVCLISNQCWERGNINPDNMCQYCDSDVDAGEWQWELDTCYINGTCYRSGTANPNNPCEYCEPGVSLTDWTARDPCLLWNSSSKLYHSFSEAFYLVIALFASVYNVQ